MNKCRILLVETQYKERLYITQTLDAQGFDIEIASDENKAIECIQQNDYQLVITEHNSTQIDGDQVLLAARQKKSEMPVLIFSGPCTPESAVNSMKSGAFDVVLKPLSEDILKKVVARALASTKLEEQQPQKLSSKHVIVTENNHMKDLLALAQRIANSKAPVLLQGESGTGKELFARYVHKHSPRSQKTMIAVNCAALPDGLLESELFGHEKGAFTGAISRKLGKFELANDSTILLDEISEMSTYLQAKLLRVLQESEIDRVGGHHPIPIDVRVVATTNRDIETCIKEKKFRADLYYRLNVIPLKIIPLRERKNDIPILAKFFIEKYNAIDERNVRAISDDALNVLKSMNWAGNVRELENVIERAVLLSDGDQIQQQNLFIGDMHKVQTGKHMPGQVMGGTLKEMERRMIFHTLDQTSGNRTHAADILGISVRTLRNKLNEYRNANYEI
ncbi:two component, sigma54 specific, transcriptional regulator, Fis family [Candidatus Magnetomorum sp. HK-1]|nr:two component, sigma54 specific, transcriptional regulator, Fis family [Candidatus Magnetomorum sp. HK-1]